MLMTTPNKSFCAARTRSRRRYRSDPAIWTGSTILAKSPSSRPLRAEAENPTPLAPEEQAIEDAVAAVQVLRDRLEAQRRAELADYGRALAAALTERLAALNLPCRCR
jgi:hypothetical protein